MDRLRVGIVGSKFAATLHAKCYRRNNKVEVVAVTALDDLEKFVKKFHIPHTYEDFEVEDWFVSQYENGGGILPFRQQKQNDQKSGGEDTVTHHKT
jgi:hypothetical protein